jgi:transcriptional adapter 2-alpha
MIFFKNQAAERRLEKEDRDLLNRIKVFAKMMTKEDFDQFAEGLISKWKVYALTPFR